MKIAEGAVSVLLTLDWFITEIYIAIIDWYYFKLIIYSQQK